MRHTPGLPRLQGSQKNSKRPMKVITAKSKARPFWKSNFDIFFTYLSSFGCLFVCNWGHLLWRRGPIEGPRSIPNMPCQLQVVAGIILAASPRCFPYTIAKSAMRDTAVGIWSALERGNRGQHRPGWAPRVRQGALLTTGLVQTLLGHQLSSRWTPFHKPSSNSGHPIAWITATATDASLNVYF